MWVRLPPRAPVAGYLDVQAALLSNDLADASAMSPNVVFGPTTQTVSLVTGTSVVWGNSTNWTTSVVWGTNVCERQFRGLGKQCLLGQPDQLRLQRSVGRRRSLE